MDNDFGGCGNHDAYERRLSAGRGHCSDDMCACKTCSHGKAGDHNGWGLQEEGYGSNPLRQAAESDWVLDCQIAHIKALQCRVVFVLSNMALLAAFGRTLAKYAQLEMGNLNIEIPTVFGGPPKGVCPRILYRIAGERGSSRGLSNKGSSRKGPLLTTLPFQPS